MFQSKRLTPFLQTWFYCLTLCCIISSLSNHIVLAQSTSFVDKTELIFSGEVFSRLKHSKTQSQHFSNFDLDRAELGIQSPETNMWGGELRLESIRSAGPNSLMGIDGDSLLLRIKRAWGYGQWQGKHWKVQSRFGLIPDPWHLIVMNSFPLRALGPSQGEREGLQDTSDLGASVQVTYRQQKLFMSLTNGEGRRFQEQNQGKNLLFGADFLIPLSWASLKLSTAYRDGSKGTSSGREHRLYFASHLRANKVHLGTISAKAWGLRNRPTLEAFSAEFWLATWLVPKYLGFFLQGEWIEYQQNQVILLSQADNAPSVMSNTLSSISANRWSIGFSQNLSSIASQYDHRKSNTMSGFRLSVFEALNYRGSSNLKSPVYGVPQLAEEWLISLILNLSWGPMPLHSTDAQTPNFY